MDHEFECPLCGIQTEILLAKEEPIIGETWLEIVCPKCEATFLVKSCIGETWLEIVEQIS